MTTSREERQRRTAEMHKCESGRCGNVTSPGKKFCAACEPPEDLEFEMLEWELQEFERNRSFAGLISLLRGILQYIKK